MNYLNCTIINNRKILKSTCKQFNWHCWGTEQSATDPVGKFPYFACWYVFDSLVMIECIHTPVHQTQLFIIISSKIVKFNNTMIFIIIYNNTHRYTDKITRVKLIIFDQLIILSSTILCRCASLSKLFWAGRRIAPSCWLILKWRASWNEITISFWLFRVLLINLFFYKLILLVFAIIISHINRFVFIFSSLILLEKSFRRRRSPHRFDDDADEHLTCQHESVHCSLAYSMLVLGPNDQC